MWAIRRVHVGNLRSCLKTAWHRQAKHEAQWSLEEEIHAPIPSANPNRWDPALPTLSKLSRATRGLSGGQSLVVIGKMLGTLSHRLTTTACNIANKTNTRRVNSGRPGKCPLKFRRRARNCQSPPSAGAESGLPSQRMQPPSDRNAGNVVGLLFSLGETVNGGKQLWSDLSL